jgi:hypothetical protein
LGSSRKRLDESAFWMELIIKSALLRESDVTSLHTEAKEIAKIMARSRITASEKIPPRKARN